jgi:membrane protease YdiL (CAAX protease family)
MQKNSISMDKGIYRLGLFVLFLVCGLLIYFVNLTFPALIPLTFLYVSKISLIIIFLVSAILLYRKKHREKYGKVFFAFFAASTAVFLSLLLSKWGLRILNLEISTLNGITVSKLIEDLFIIFSVIVLIKISRDDMASIYVTRGNLRLGLVIGLTSFIFLFLLSVLQATGQYISLARFISFAPSLLIISLADGFMEELLFRGLFLKRFEPFLGAGLANVLTALVYSLVHLQVTFTPNLPVFLIATFLLGLLWGYMMQKTGSILAPALFHAGVDTMIMLDFFASLGIA